MSRKPPGIAALSGAVAAAVLLVGGVVVAEVLLGTVAREGSAGVPAPAVRLPLYGGLLALALLAVLAALLAGRALARAMDRLRAAVLARARGDAAAPLPTSGIAELAGLAGAVERLSARDAAREAAARREGDEVSVLLDAISEGIVRLDSAGRVVRTNPAARALLGLTENAMGQPVATRVRHAELRGILQRAAAGEAVTAAEITLHDRRLIVSARPLRGGSDGDDGGAVVAFVDLTEVRRLESVRRDFVANVSHELKTPLTSIRGYAETLLADEDMPDDVRRGFLEVVQKNAERLHAIVDELLDLSRLESGGWRPELEDLDAAELVADVWSGCDPRARERRITFVPPTDTARVHADPGALRQVLTNLFDNALRHTPDGGRIEVRLRTLPDAVVEFGVHDSGSGIPAEALPRIFERFYRADPARSRAAGGTGLGLSIVKHLVERMGGGVTAASELGRGTLIRFTLPASR